MHVIRTLPCYHLYCFGESFKLLVFAVIVLCFVIFWSSSSEITTMVKSHSSSSSTSSSSSFSPSSSRTNEFSSQQGQHKAQQQEQGKRERIEKEQQQQQEGGGDGTREINDDPRQWDSSLFPSSSSSSSSSSRKTATSEQVHSLRQCRPLGKKFASAVASWLASTNTLDNDDDDEEDSSKEKEDDENSKNNRNKNKKQTIKKRLIYTCESHRRGGLCGGMGDRFRGIVSSAFLALLSKRKFEIFHPVPVPLQELYVPRFINWIPSIRRRGRDSSKRKHSLNSAKSYRELDEHLQSIPVNRMLMRQKENKRIVPLLLPFMTSTTGKKGSVNEQQQQVSAESLDIKIQSNTAGIDKYLLRDQVLKQRWTNDLGLPLNCNLTCYFGCMYALLFQPSKSLEKEMHRVLERFEIRKGKGGGSKIPLAQAVLDVHHQRRKSLLPLVGLQLRVGGSWASGFRVREPFRTVPAAFPYVFEDVKRIRCNLKARKCPSWMRWPVFVTSDSERFVNLTRDTLVSSSSSSASAAARKAAQQDREVFFVPENSYQHTDTMNVHHALPDKFKKQHKSFEKEVASVYRMTLINHAVLAASGSLVMGQSGFADVAFWAARNSDETRIHLSSSSSSSSSQGEDGNGGEEGEGEEDVDPEEQKEREEDKRTGRHTRPTKVGEDQAGGEGRNNNNNNNNNDQNVFDSGTSHLNHRPAGLGFFVDMTNNRIAWEHTLTFPDNIESEKPSPAIAGKNRVVDFVNRREAAEVKPFL